MHARTCKKLFKFYKQIHTYTNKYWWIIVDNKIRYISASINFVYHLFLCSLSPTETSMASASPSTSKTHTHTHYSSICDVYVFVCVGIVWYQFFELEYTLRKQRVGYLAIEHKRRNTHRERQNYKLHVVG